MFINLEVDFSERAIKEWYDRFGRILWYVLPVRTKIVMEAEWSQASVIAGTKLVNVFVPHANIEKVDLNYILHYKV